MSLFRENPMCPVCGKDRPMTEHILPMCQRTYLRASWDGHEGCREAWDRVCEERRSEELRRTYQADLEARLEAGFGQCQVNWQSKSLANFEVTTEGQRKIVEFFKNWKAPAKGVILYGPPGTGKTHLLVAQARYIAERDSRGFAFIKLNPWLGTLRSMDFSQQEGAVERLEKTPVLFIDDIGAEKMTEWAESMLERIFDARLEFNRPLFASTNLEDSALAQMLTPRSWSRLRGLVGFAPLGGKDRRVKRGT